MRLAALVLQTIGCKSVLSLEGAEAWLVDEVYLLEVLECKAVVEDKEEEEGMDVESLSRILLVEDTLLADASVLSGLGNVLL